MDLSLRMAEDFLKNPVWEDMRSSIYERVELVRNDLESTPPTDLSAMSSLQGELKSLRWILTLPDLIVKDLSEESGQAPEESIEESEESDGI